MGPDLPSAWRRVAGRGVYPVQYASWLLSPLRRLLLSPERLVRWFNATGTERILEIGCGPGYFSPAASRAVPDGGLMILDTQEVMVSMALDRLRRAGCANIAGTVADASHLPFADCSYDIAFLATVLGETSNPAKAMREAARTLRPGGRLFVTEALGDPDHVRARDVLSLAEGAGLIRTGSWAGGLIRTDRFTRPAHDR